MPGRTSSWPYGSARAPTTSTTVPRAGRAASSGSRTTIPPSRRRSTMSGGVPSRPASAVTMPRTRDGGADRRPPRVRDGRPGRSDSGSGCGGGAGGGRAGSVRGWRWPSASAMPSDRASRSAPGVGVGAGVGVGVGRGHDEVGRAGDVQAVAGRAGPGAVALAERATCAGSWRRSRAPTRQGVRRDDQPDRPAAVVDRHGRAVGEGRRVRSAATPVDGEPPRPRTPRSRRRSRRRRRRAGRACPTTTMSAFGDAHRPLGVAGRDASRSAGRGSRRRAAPTTGVVEVDRDPGRRVLDEGRRDRTRARRGPS